MAASNQVPVIDCSNYTGEITSAIVQCLYASGVRHAIVRCSLETAAKTALAQRQMAALTSGGVKVHGYLWTYSTDNPVAMANQTILMFGDLLGDGYYFLDIEDVGSWAGVAPAAAVNWHLSAFATLDNAAKRAAVYSADWCWEPIMGGSTLFSKYLLWDADYDHIADTGVFVPFGGWDHCDIKQYGDSSSCAPAMDLDVANAGILDSPVPVVPPVNPPTPVGPDIASAQGRLNSIITAAQAALEDLNS